MYRFTAIGSLRRMRAMPVMESLYRFFWFINIFLCTAIYARQPCLQNRHVCTDCYYLARTPF